MIRFGKLISFGGVVLSSNQGTIICKNTLDLRLQLSFEALMPEIRKIINEPTDQ